MDPHGWNVVAITMVGKHMVHATKVSIMQLVPEASDHLDLDQWG